MRLPIALVAVFLLTLPAAAQRPVFDPDDFVDPRQTGGRPVLAMRVVAGGAVNFIDGGYRPLGQDVGFVHVVGGFYWKRLQLDYKHSEVRGEENGPAEVSVCRCDPDVYFPTAPSPRDVPAAPLPAARETLQAAVYFPIRGGPGRIPIMLRSRITWSRQPADTIVRSVATGEIVERRHGREETLGIETDTYLRIRGREIWGSLQYASIVREGTTDDRRQRELTYTNRFPAIAFEKSRILVRAMLTVGGVSNRGGTAINVISPAFEAFRHEPKTRANFHLVWTPQSTHSGAGGWKTTHQVAFFVDWGLVKLF